MKVPSTPRIAATLPIPRLALLELPFSLHPMASQQTCSRFKWKSRQRNQAQNLSIYRVSTLILAIRGRGLLVSGSY